MKTRKPRVAVIFPARLRIAGQWTDVRVRNISSRGMLLEIDSPPTRGCYLEIARGRHRYTARVAWAEGRQCGVQVRELIDVPEFIGAKSSGIAAVRSAGVPARMSVPRRYARIPALGRLGEFVLIAVAASTAGAAVAQSTFEHFSTVIARVSTELAG